MPEVPAETSAWPKWLTPEHSAIHTAFENEIVKALDHCYASADAAGMNWTTEGWISCSASNIMSLLHRLGCPPPPVEVGIERLSLAEVERQWAVPWDDDDEALNFDGAKAAEACSTFTPDGNTDHGWPSYTCTCGQPSWAHYSDGDR